VRLNLFKRLNDLNKVIGLENLQQAIVPALKDLSEDKNWRIKLSVVEQYPRIAEELGEAFFTEKFVPVCVKWLNDNIYSIRVAAITNLKELTKLLGSQWAERNVIRHLLELQTDSNYLHRLTPLFGISELNQVVPSDTIKKLFVPVLQQLAKDNVPNVRMNVSKTIYEIRKKMQDKQMVGPIETSVESELLQILNELKSDSDDDVKFYTKKAIQLK
jgi:serine/threonine-protein phosphatase 2A regulatory subunit A